MAFQGSLEELPLPDIIQLVSVSGKTGVFTLTRDDETGRIYLQDGQIVHAEAAALSGDEAVYELAIWPEGEFLFTPGEEPSRRSIEKSNTNLLMEAARRIDEWQVLSKRIPSTRMVPVFTDQNTSSSVSFTPEEWAIVRKVDERRSIEEIATGLGSSAFDTCKTLYGLITSEIVELREDLRRLHADRLRALDGEDLEALAARIHEQARRVMANHDRADDLDSAYELSRSELARDRQLDAVIDLIRAEERIISSALGPNQARSFLDHVQRLLSAA